VWVALPAPLHPLLSPPDRSVQEGPARPQAQEPEFQELSLGDLFLMLWRGRWIILICTVVLTGIGFKYVEQRGTVYRAQSRIYIDAQAPSMLSADGNLLSVGNRNYANTQAELIRSRNVFDQTLLKPEVAASPLFPEGTSKIGWLQQALKVSVGVKDDIVSVSLESNQVEEACLLVNAIVDTYRRLHSEKGNTRARELRAIAVAKRDEKQHELDALHASFIEFLHVNAELNIDVTPGATGLSRKVELAYEELRALENELTELSTRLDTAHAFADEPRLMREFLGDTAQPYDRRSDRISELQLSDAMRRSSAIADEIREARRQRTDLLEQGRTAANPMVVAIDEQIAQLQEQQTALQEELALIEQRLNDNEHAAEAKYAAGLLQKLEREREALATQVTLAREVHEALQTQMNSVYPKRAEHDRLRNQITQSEKLIEGLNLEISEYSKADISEEERSKITIEVLDRASPDTSKVAQSVPKTLAIFLLLGLMSGCGLAWLRAMLDRKVRNEDDVQRATGLPVVGALPRTKLRADKVDAIQAWDDHYALAEAARGLRTAIAFSLPKGKGKIIQVTSADKGDGKSTTAAQLAIAMAQAGQRVLLVDADLRSPRVAKVFHLSNEQGLSNILAQGLTLDEVVQSTRVSGLDVVTSGPVPINPAELLNGEEFGALLAHLSDRYDRVVLDTPPVLAVSDARVVAGRVDATLLVARVDKTDRRRLEAALDRVHSIGVRPLGVILNDVPRGVGYGYGYGNGYGYGYGYGNASGIDLSSSNGASERRNGFRPPVQEDPAPPAAASGAGAARLRPTREKAAEQLSIASDSSRATERPDTLTATTTSTGAALNSRGAAEPRPSIRGAAAPTHLQPESSPAQRGEVKSSAPEAKAPRRSVPARLNRRDKE
jgi:succinoglycan biosynthesis transport protein ExoP